MKPTKDRVIVKEFAEVAAHYVRYNQACAGGKVTLSLFWGQLRHQLRSKQMDAFLEVGYDLLLCHAMASPRSATPKLSFSFTYADSDTKACCDVLSQRLGLTKADTIKLLVVCNSLLDASKALASFAAADLQGADVLPSTQPAQSSGATGLVIAQTQQEVRFNEKVRGWVGLTPGKWMPPL